MLGYLNPDGHYDLPLQNRYFQTGDLATRAADGAIACCEVRVKSDASVIAAFYTARNLLDQQELSAFAAQRLAQYKRPRIYVHVDTLPRGANSKLLRRKLRQDWEASNG